MVETTRREFLRGGVAAAMAASLPASTWTQAKAAAAGNLNVIAGALAGQNWHRQIRRLNLNPVQRLDYMIKKTASVATQFGFSPMGIDMGAPPSSDAKYLDELKARLASENLFPVGSVSGVTATYDEEVRRAGYDSARQSLELAARMGIRTCMFGTQRNGRATREATIRFAIESTREVGKIAKGYNIRMCQEDFDYFTSAELIRICKETGLDNVGINSDTGNWLILKEEPVAATKKCMPYTLHSHVRDYVLENGVYNGVALGRGMVDFKKILPMLVQAGAKERFILSVELDTDNRDEDEECHESYRYLKEWLVANSLMNA